MCSWLHDMLYVLNFHFQLSRLIFLKPGSYHSLFLFAYKKLQVPCFRNFPLLDTKNIWYLIENILSTGNIKEYFFIYSKFFVTEKWLFAVWASMKDEWNRLVFVRCLELYMFWFHINLSLFIYLSSDE